MTKTKYIVSNCNNIGIKQMGKFQRWEEHNEYFET